MAGEVRYPQPTEAPAMQRLGAATRQVWPKLKGWQQDLILRQMAELSDPRTSPSQRSAIEAFISRYQRAY